jgi:hypothetical protein
MNNLLLLNELISSNTLSPAPEKTERLGLHLQADIAIGVDHTAHLTLCEEAESEITELLVQEIRGCSLNQAIQFSKATGRRICREGWTDKWLVHTVNEEFGNEVVVMMKHDWKAEVPYRFTTEDILTEDWIIIE